MNITLRAGERIYINGAVIRMDRKATLELMNDATFLLEAHVMQASDATTPLRQIYFVIQIVLMDPAAAQSTRRLASDLIEKALLAVESSEIRTGLKSVGELLNRTRYFEAMKVLRAMYGAEQREMFPSADAEATNAA